MILASCRTNTSFSEKVFPHIRWKLYLIIPYFPANTEVPQNWTELVNICYSYVWGLDSSNVSPFV